MNVINYPTTKAKALAFYNITKTFVDIQELKRKSSCIIFLANFYPSKTFLGPVFVNVGIILLSSQLKSMEKAGKSAINLTTAVKEVMAKGDQNWVDLHTCNKREFFCMKSQSTEARVSF